MADDPDNDKNVNKEICKVRMQYYAKQKFEYLETLTNDHLAKAMEKIDNCVKHINDNFKDQNDENIESFEAVDVRMLNLKRTANDDRYNNMQTFEEANVKIKELMEKGARKEARRKTQDKGAVKSSKAGGPKKEKEKEKEKDHKCWKKPIIASVAATKEKKATDEPPTSTEKVADEKENTALGIPATTGTN